MPRLHLKKSMPSSITTRGIGPQVTIGPRHMEEQQTITFLINQIYLLKRHIKTIETTMSINPTSASAQQEAHNPKTPITHKVIRDLQVCQPSQNLGPTFFWLLLFSLCGAQPLICVCAVCLDFVQQCKEPAKFR